MWLWANYLTYLNFSLLSYKTEMLISVRTLPMVLLNELTYVTHLAPTKKCYFLSTLPLPTSSLTPGHIQWKFGTETRMAVYVVHLLRHSLETLGFLTTTQHLLSWMWIDDISPLLPHLSCASQDPKGGSDYMFHVCIVTYIRKKIISFYDSEIKMFYFSGRMWK